MGWIFLAIVVVVVIINIIADEVVYDGDYRCAIAQCRIVKK